MEKYRLLIIDDARNLSLLYQEEFQEEGYEADIARSIPDARVLLNMKLYDLIIVGIRLKKDFDHENIWSELNLMIQEIPVIIVSEDRCTSPGGSRFLSSNTSKNHPMYCPLKKKFMNWSINMIRETLLWRRVRSNLKQIRY